MRDFCLIVIAGNTYNHRIVLKELGFRAIKIEGQWLQYRRVLEDKLNHWKKEIESKDSSLVVFKANNYNHWSEIESLLKPRLALVKEALELEREINPPTEPTGIEVSSFIEVKKWYAGIVKDELNLGFMFRNWRVKKIYRETQKAVLVDAEAFGGILTSCGVCGRKLDNKISKATGIGPICAEKIGLERPTMENAKEIVEELEKKVKALKPITKKWIPKSQISKGVEDIVGKLALG